MNDMSEGHEVMTVESGTVAVLNKSEIDQQITTAHKYPRSLARFRSECLAMVTLSETIASECIYALPRDGKTIEGPSARFAEVVASAWGNSRAGARVVDEGPEFITAQGVFHDLEKNVAITYEVRRRITDKNGRRFKADMIGVTANAACSIALRNAILKGVPKAFWAETYSAARKVVAGDVRSLANRRAEAIKAFAPFGVTQEQILTRLGRGGVQDVTIDDLVVLSGFLNAIKDGDGSPETIFSQEAPTATSGTLDAINAKVKDASATAKTPPAESVDKQTGEITQAASLDDTFAPSYADVSAAIKKGLKTKSADELAAAESLIGSVKDTAQRASLRSEIAEAKAALA